jgi:hypothetical protein
MAFDNNTGSRWESTQGVDPSWIYVDLGSVCSISTVVINWEAAAGQNYTIDVASGDPAVAGNWTTIQTVTGNNTGGVHTYSNLSGTGRYVRMYGTTRDSPYGYSIYEMQAIGIRGAVNSPPVITSALTASGVTGTAFNYQITATNTPTSYNATGLPAGLSVNTATGAITGTPSAVGTTNVTISATNTYGTGQASLAITISSPPPAPVITSALTASGTTGVAFNYQITASNTPTSYNATPLPAGLSINTGTGVISGTPTAVGSTNVTISATNAGGTGSATLVITIAAPTQPPVITSATSTAGTAGTAFSYQITATNSPTSYNATGLPGGLSVNTTNGLISGTPSAAGTSSVTISATNGNGTGSATLTLTISAAGAAPTITSAATASGTIGSAFSYQITATNSPTSFNAVGLPSGLTVNGSTGLISGTPASGTAGNYSVYISATNAAGTGYATLTITINGTTGAPAITSALSANGTPGSAFSYQITGSNTPTSYNAINLPTGLAINTSTGVLSGTLQFATGISASATISATNASGTGYATLTIVSYSPNATAIAYAEGGSFTRTAATGLVGMNFTVSSSINVISLGFWGDSLGGDTPWVALYDVTTTTQLAAITTYGTGYSGYKYISLGSPVTLTPGHTYQIVATAYWSPKYANTTGFKFGSGITPVGSGVAFTTPGGWGGWGTPTMATAALTTPANIQANFQYTPVTSPPVINSALTATGTTGSAFNYQISATNSPTSYNATGLPSGLSVNTSTGAITGTPTATGSSNVTISATNAGGTGSATLALTVNPPAPVINSTLTASGTTGSSFSYQITATNSPTSYNATSLPNGLSVNTSTGVISGTPTATGSSNVTISATNAGGTGSATLVLTVNPPAPVISSPLTASGTAGSSFSYQITATNSPTSYNATNLPNGLSVNTSTGVISGTPTATGSSNVTISATNAGGTGSATLALTINPPAPVITSALTASGTTGSSFSYQITATNSPTSYGATGLPNGLSIDGNSGVISGTPTATGSSNVTISATNAGGTGSATLVLTVNPPAPVVNSAPTASAIKGSTFNYQITATNNPTGYDATGLPAGLSVDIGTGIISGTPSAAGTSSVTISASNAGGTGSATLTLTVNEPFVGWQKQWFTDDEIANHPEISGPNATPANDGITNLMKYALNLAPKVNGTAGLPVVSTTSTGGQNYLELSYTKVIAANDITYTVEVSGNVQGWNSGASYTVVDTITNNPDGKTQTVLVRDLTPITLGSGQHFMHLKVSMP